MNILTVFSGLLTLGAISGSTPEQYTADTVNLNQVDVLTRTMRASERANNDFDTESDMGNRFSQDVFVQPYDSLLTMWQEQSRMSAFDAFFKDFIDIDSTQMLITNVPDSVYEARLKMILSPIQMPYNDIVKRYIIAYTTTKKNVMSRIIGRSQFYYQIIEPALDKHGLPLELRMLPAIESALSPVAVSRVGATGLWQFMYSTGRHYGLEITSFVDQRRDPIASTEAACVMLKDLYNLYGDWTLALAAYNCGPGNVNKAIKRAGGNTKTFWDIYPYLPRETRGYVPSFIAATYAYTFHRHHNIEPDEVPLPLITDTLMVNRLMHFNQIATTIDVPLELLRSLNPQYKNDIIPAQGKSYALTLPMGEVSKYLENEQKILAKDTVYLAQYLKPSNIDKNKQVFSISSYTYKVKSGDTLSTIASRNGVKVAQLMKWNNITNPNKLRVGQNLEIYR